MSPQSPPANASDASLLTDSQAIERIFQHIDKRTTDVGTTVWREPVEHYFDQARFDAECALIRKLPSAFCPSSALPEAGS